MDLGLRSATSGPAIRYDTVFLFLFLIIHFFMKRFSGTVYKMDYEKAQANTLKNIFRFPITLV